MTDTLQKQFQTRSQKIRKNLLEDFEGYYGDPEEWAEVADNLVQYGIFYSRCLDQVLKAAFLYNYDVKPFLSAYLLPPAQAQLNTGKLLRHHFEILRGYTIDRALVGLLLTGELDIESLKTASEYHTAHLNQYDYSDEIDLINELDTEFMLSNLVPQIIVNRLLGKDYSHVTNAIKPDIKSPEKNWMYAWQFLHALEDGDNGKRTSSWQKLVESWRACFVNSNFHAFSNSLLVLLYYTYCEKQQQPFDLSRLSVQVLVPFSSS